MPETGKTTAGTFTIRNESPTNTMYYFGGAIDCSVAHDAYNEILHNSRLPIAPGQSVTCVNKAYVWKTLEEDFIFYQADDDAGFEWTFKKTVWSLPYISTPDMSGCDEGTVLGFGKPDQIGFRAITPLSDWLDKLFLSKEFDLVWPEDTWEGEDKLAYEYWLTLLPGPPKNGLIPSAKISQIYESPGYVDNPNFKKDAFDRVFQHLSNECIYFERAFLWFGINGIANAINTQISSITSLDLTNAASIMEISEDDNVSMSLEVIMTDFSIAASEIPGIGLAIAVLINTGWSMAKLSDNKPSGNPINSTIAKMADVLVSHLQCVLDSSALQLDALNSNWGKLQAFGEGTMNGTITSKMFGMETTPTYTALSGDKKNKPKVADGYIKAASRAWSKIIFKAINSNVCNENGFYECKMIYYPDPCPANSWDPSKDIYQYTFFVKCTAVVPDEGGASKIVTGWLGLTYDYPVPIAMMKKFFGTEDDSLKIDPIEFFLEFNGWKLGYRSKTSPFYTSSDKSIRFGVIL